MRRRVCSVLELLCVFLAASLAVANPETGVWQDGRTGDEDNVVNPGESIKFAITSATDSTLFYVRTPLADLCFDPDTGGTGGAARISVYRPVDPQVATINGSILVPSIPIDNSDCVQIVNGVYWVEVTTGPSGGEAAVVTVTGRSS